MSEMSMFLHLPPPILMRRPFVVPEALGLRVEDEGVSCEE